VKAIPSSKPESREFWESANEGVLKVQYCNTCGKSQFYPRIKCKFCHSFDLDYKQSSGKGKIISYSTVYRGPSDDYPVPYTLGLVELEEGTRIFGKIIHDQALKIGMTVEVFFESEKDEYSLINFHAVEVSI
jgi:uncharacterized OB-fold protein